MSVMTDEDIRALARRCEAKLLQEVEAAADGAGYFADQRRAAAEWATISETLRRLGGADPRPA